MPSWSSKALPWLIPSLLLTAPPNSSVVLVSPWAEDVPLQVYTWVGRGGRLEGEQPLSAVCCWLAAERGIRFMLVVRDLDERARGLAGAARNCMEVRTLPDLHAKLIVTDRWVLRTSANLLARSLERNIEALDLAPNPRGDALMFLREELGRFGIRW